MSISQQQALDCFASDDLIGIGMEADSIRRRMHPERVVSYAVSRSFAVAGREMEVGVGGGNAEIFPPLSDAVSEGVTAIRVTISPASAATVAGLQRSFSDLRGRFPSLRMESLSAQEILDLAVGEGADISDLLLRLREAGLDAISGEIGQLDVERWRSVHRLAHNAGLRSAACMPFGGVLPSEDFVDHLLSIRALQEETGGFTSFSLKVMSATSGRGEFEEPTAVEYLRALAISRITLDNFAHIESDSTQQGLKVAQMALRFGANDAGTIGVASNDPRSRFTESDLRRVIRDAGFVPAERDGLYRTMFLNN